MYPLNPSGALEHEQFFNSRNMGVLMKLLQVETEFRQQNIDDGTFDDFFFIDTFISVTTDVA